MGKPFTEFIVRLCTDRKALTRYNRDREADIKRQGLTAKQAAALRSGESTKINTEILREWPDSETGGHGGIKNIFFVTDWLAPGKAKKRASKSGPRKTPKKKRK